LRQPLPACWVKRSRRRMAVRLAGGKRQLSRKARLLLLTGKLMHAGQPASPAPKTSHSPVLLNHLVACITSGFTSQTVRDYSYNTATCPPLPPLSPTPLLPLCVRTSYSPCTSVLVLCMQTAPLVRYTFMSGNVCLPRLALSGLLGKSCFMGSCAVYMRGLSAA